MPFNILMPALSPTMEEGTLARWLVTEGQSVTSGSVLAEIETDKAIMDFEAAHDGTISKIVIPDGTTGVKVNELIAVLLVDGEGANALEVGASAAVAKTASANGANATRRFAQGRNGPNMSLDPAGGSRVFASPLARRVATENGLDLAQLTGTGPGGRIIKTDVVSASPKSQVSAPDARTSKKGSLFASPGASVVRKMYADRDFQEIALDGVRKIVAERVSEAKQTIPHFYVRRDVRVDALLAVRSEMNQQRGPHGPKLSVNDFIIKASANALQKVPECNAVWAGDRILRFQASDIAVAVSTGDGLVTPVLRDADTKTLSTLSAEMKEVAARARGHKLAPNEYQGGSLTISNLGMMGIESFDAVINPPHAAILAIGTGVRKPVVNETGEIEAATVISATLSVDHRIIDGAVAARFLEMLTRCLEHPISLLS